MNRLIYLLLFLIIGCNNPVRFYVIDPPPINGVPDPVDDSIVVSRAFITINNGQIVSFNRVKKPSLLNILIPKAVAYTGGTPPSATINISYANTASSSFNLNSGAISPTPTFTPDGLTLDFGNISMSSLDDNSLKKCGAVGTDAGAGSTKCNTAIIRVYASAGDAGGVFCNSLELYCVPMKVNNAVFGVGVANAQNVITHTIPSNINRLRASQLAQTSWPLVVDMSNAGEGNYSATIIVEYVLKRL